jgi:hypothetical protein
VKVLKKVFEAIKKWYDGEERFFENPPDAGILYFGSEYKRHWTAKFARKVVEFLAKDWKWAIATMLASIGLIIAYLRLPK